MLGRRIALFLNDGKNDYQQMQLRDCQEAARRHDFACSVYSAENDSTKQLAQIRSALSEHEDRRALALLVSPVREVSLIAASYEAARLGVGWALLSRWHDSILDLRRQFPALPVFSVTPDQCEAGRVQGRQARTLLAAHDELFCIRGPLGTSTTPKRAAGLDQELSDRTALRRTHFNGDWSLESGLRIMRDWLRLFARGELPRFVLAAQSDSMAMGARQALLEWAGPKRRSVVDAVPILGCNGSPSYGQRLVTTGELTATVIIPSVASRAVVELSACLDGRARPAAEITVQVQSFPELGALASKVAPRPSRH